MRYVTVHAISPFLPLSSLPLQSSTTYSIPPSTSTSTLLQAQSAGRLLQRLIEQLRRDGVLRVHSEGLVEDLDGVVGPPELHVDEALGGEDGGVAPPAEAQDLVELVEGLAQAAGAAVGVREVGAGREPGLGLGADVVGDLEGLGEEGGGLAGAVLVVVDDAHLVEEQRVGLAEAVGGAQELVGERHVVQGVVLHAEEDLRQVRAHEEAGGGRVGRDGLVVLALGGEGVGEPDPGGAEVRVHHAGLAEVPARLGDLVDGEVVDAHGEPRARLLRVVVGQVVRHEEEHVLPLQLVQARQVQRVDAEVVLVLLQHRLRDGERVLVPALRVQEVGLGEAQVRVRREVVVRGQRLAGRREGVGVAVLGEPRGVEHPRELGGLLRRRRVAAAAGHGDGIEV